MPGLQRVDLARAFIGWFGDELRPILHREGPPPAIDGVTIGLFEMVVPPPHNGERHADGDELVIVVTGKVRVLLDDEPAENFEISQGEACIIPKGRWHRVQPLEPSRIVHLTPGPNNDHR